MGYTYLNVIVWYRKRYNENHLLVASRSNRCCWLTNVLLICVIKEFDRKYRKFVYWFDVEWMKFLNFQHDYYWFFDNLKYPYHLILNKKPSQTSFLETGYFRVSRQQAYHFWIAQPESYLLYFEVFGISASRFCVRIILSPMLVQVFFCILEFWIPWVTEKHRSSKQPLKKLFRIFSTLAITYLQKTLKWFNVLVVFMTLPKKMIFPHKNRLRHRSTWKSYTKMSVYLCFQEMEKDCSLVFFARFMSRLRIERPIELTDVKRDLKLELIFYCNIINFSENI